MLDSSPGQVAVVVRRFIHILTGIVLIFAGGYLIVRAAHSLGAVWHNEAAVKPTQKQNPPIEPDDVAAARLKVYGVLAPHDDVASAGSDNISALRTTGPVFAIDRVDASPATGPHHFLHRRLSLRSYRGFRFVVPAHALHPRLEGTFRSITKGNGQDSTNVGVMLLDKREFEDLLHHREGTASFSAAGPGGEVDWTLSPTFSEPQNYYLVFRNSSEKSAAALVDVDFTISFQ
jgi:hypothetical protein